MEEGARLSPEVERLDHVPPLGGGATGLLTKNDGLEDPESRVEAPPRGAKGRADSGDRGPRSAQKAGADQREQAAAQGHIQASWLRKELSRLDKLRADQELFIQKTREELHACCQRMDAIAKQQEHVAAEAAAEREANNTAAAGRLQAVSRRLCTELQDERDLQSKIRAVLRESESALWHIEIQEGQLEAARTCALEEAEAAWRRRQVQAAERLRKEADAQGRAERNRLLRTRHALRLRKEHGLRHQKLQEDARKSHRTAVQFLKASLGRVREQEREQELQAREHLRRRMDAVLALKNSIAANRETLRKFQAWGQAKAVLAEQKAQAEKQAILAQGGDAFKRLLHQHRRQELEAQSRAFEEQQKLRKQEIVSRILKEAAEEDRKGRPRSPPKAAARPALRDRTWDYLADLSEGRAPAAPCCPVSQPRVRLPSRKGAVAPGPGLSGLVEGVSSGSFHGDPRGAGQEDKTLAEPEIPGLWNEDYELHQVPEEGVDRKPVGGTKMDKDILARTMARLRSGVTHKQVVSGREFKGCPFNSKPKVIHFKDFDVGKVYKKKMTLTNATYTINYCRLEGVDEHLRDFIHIDFDPPGPMSAGMSCEVLVTFKPMINRDLEGSISFRAQTGRFAVPLKCSIKQCSLSLDKELIDFGSYVVGETASRSVTLTNTGGLGTRFRVLPASESCEIDISPSVLKLSSIFTDEDKFCEKGTSSVWEQQLEVMSSQWDVLSQKEPDQGRPREEDEGRPAESEGVAAITFSNGEQGEISLGDVTEGEIGPFSSVKVPITFSPVTPGAVQAKFKVMFKNRQCPTLHFEVIGVAIDVPVWVPKPDVDLKICMYDRLYQDSILVHTRSKAALRLKFEVCKELRGHMELLPETGYIQALSSFSVQLKFLPRHSLPEDAGQYFDKESRVLEAPMVIRVADQIRPVEFTVHAIVTTSDLELSPSEVDFGYCTVYEAVRAPISLYNHSLLPQEFGFVGLPKCVDIQPNDGFGTILPLETLEFDLIFQPTRAKAYSFELVCKSEINRRFKLTCRAVGVQPPLQLSHHQVKFAATSLYDTSVATLYVTNPHPGANSRTHPAPGAGSGDARPTGPTSFEFLLPPGSPITISPSVGTVLPGKRCLVQVAFRPVLSSELIRQHAIQALTKDGEIKLLRKDTATPRRDLRRQSLAVQRGQYRDRLFRASTSLALELQKQDLKFRWAPRRLPRSYEYEVARAALTRSFQGQFDKFVVPCVVASGDVQDRKGSEPLSFSPHNTLYLELWCPAVAPSIIVTSDKGKTVSNFGEVAVGHRGIKKVSIQNITSEDLAMDFSVLNPNGPFVLLNPISRLPAGETHVLVLSFSPRESMLAQETLDIITKRGTLSLTLMGTGVASMITCSIQGDVLHMGYVIARESVSSTFQLQNNSSLPIKFSMRLDSLSSTRHEDRQQLPRFLTSATQRTDVVGTQNHSGQSVFSVVPVEGILDPGAVQDFTVTFSPDHESLYFSDRLQVVLFEKKVSQQILLKGAAREHMMFVEGGDPLDVPVESLTGIPAWDPERREGEPQPGPTSPEAEEPKPILVTLDHLQLDADTPAPPATRELQVGCIRTTQLSPKKTVEFSLDSVAALQHKGFTLDPPRGTVERGQTKTISISWVPPADFDPDRPLLVSALLQLRGDVKETYKVFFIAQVLTGP
ncbi:cilia- and flagella-associated protein 74 [Pteronotus mesoamericanus]|uniref:cilia- and flagella-associated protein 74 n=1 Tax=Pteronotus mesoamericanus TaxID=1884717 RepID=UPI0023ECF8C4|nr:cilia- and flagella-associated protein 74 [Pteronotus parnellii mesoamericanus]